METKRKSNKKVSDDSIVRMPCIKCGVIVEKYLHPDAIRGYRMYCPDHSPERWSTTVREKDTSDADILYLAHKIYTNYGVSSPVTVYKPGDPGFDEIAAQCSKPFSKDPIPFYDPFEHKTFHDRRDKLS